MARRLDVGSTVTKLRSVNPDKKFMRISEEAYQRLRKVIGMEIESFSEIIIRFVDFYEQHVGRNK
jgi:hypothetical protein